MKTKKTFLGPSCIILFLLFGVVLTSSPALAADKTVCASGCDQTTIQAGIDDAFDDVPSGGTVTVTDSRTYTECITMKDGVDVISSVGETPTIDCTTAWTATVTFENGITCNLDGFDITHSSGAGAGVAVDGLSGTVTTTISNCTIHNIADSGGIRMNGVVDCTITGNTIYDCGKGGIGVGEVGTLDDVQDGSSITIKDNTIGDDTDPYTDPNLKAGIYLQGSGSVTVVIGTVAEPNRICYNAEGGIRLDTITDLTIDANTIDNNTKGGILLIDVGSASGDAIVQNNNINGNSKAGINIGGASYLTIGDNNTINNNYAGVVFNMGALLPSQYPGSASSGPVTITGNNINTNSKAGIGIIDAITNTVTITDQNDIHANGTDDAGGIGIQNNCTLVITKNKIHDNVRGGIHTGTQASDPGGFSGTAGSADLTIGQNKVYGNGEGGFGGGIDVRHADGTIYNNLVYENQRGGVRFGDWIDAIINNSVADNGNGNRGGGIVYDDITAGDPVNAVPAGDPPATLDIRNNICAYNEKAGIRACFANTPGSEERDYNLVYANNATGETDCGYSTNNLSMSCTNQNLGGCGGKWNPSPPPYVLMDGQNNIVSDPEFENRTTDNYRIKSSSPAVDAGDTSYGNDVSIPPGVGTLIIDMGAYGGPDGINW